MKPAKNYPETDKAVELKIFSGIFLIIYDISIVSKTAKPLFHFNCICKVFKCTNLYLVVTVIVEHKCRKAFYQKSIEHSVGIFFVSTKKYVMANKRKVNFSNNINATYFDKYSAEKFEAKR